ncbi:bifunctional D-glycero-beta-D-manno-heptose-7-phosphate kinase/D-glycero-beta-D-manno-heptose 1-phosphate adenylyltransferase HldE [Acidicapsa acidisoli]|uniref:bifunctional D-glycero-beta-D-manno-heptose-7-phosphate kinase/D-glycero-beta-D-manno-heptose 1-phosphate adenylyltransferase HldE n=1 Tax=Acidicapsa acidisoli TaxID=1615681 RepID=UPI0021E0E3B4|nr:bifunctional D-glycero-beta-D-manno-heptose-7-phosphate kinase/D-glycero-beta-D-manno-heptose 1-phosphate adenylyltransferase HldE [Acidicapsa acidisoli]
MIEQLHEVIHKIEQEWPAKRLLVLGDVMLDKYIWGDVGRISPEAPVPVVRATHQSEQPGGAANVAMNLAKLGAGVVLVGFTGGDADEELLTSGLRVHGIDPAFVACEGFPTVTKTRIVGGRQQMLRLDSENLGKRADGEHERLLARVRQELPSCHAVVLSDYAKGVLEPKLCQAVIAEARKLGIPVLVDPKTADFSRYRGATTICPNLQELSVASREDVHNLEAMLAAGERMVGEFDLEYLTATLSEKGIAVIRPGNRFVAPAVARQVFDVSGAGDTVIAVLALCLASGLGIEPSVQLANIAAGIVVGKVGTVPVEKHELLAALAPDIALHAEDKVLTREELMRRVAVWRASGERVVFTNGCFDLLHVGHITVLEQSRRLGDRLIVAINSDASVSCLKGPSRPVVSENDRARVLAALAAVDAVVIFGEATPLEVILAARPDVIVKGGDYNEDTVVGAKEVKSWGGKVAIVPIVEGHSTTRLIERSIAG